MPALITERELWTEIFKRVDPENLERPLHEIRWHITKLETLAHDLENAADWVEATFYAKAEVDEKGLTEAGAPPVKSDEPEPKTVDWDRIKTAMGTITTELDKVEWSDEEQTQIEQITSDLQDVLKQYTSLSRSAKLWVLATLAHKYMEELDNVETD